MVGGRKAMFEMRRREFVMLLGTAAAVWPHRARGQQRTITQTQKVYRIGFLFAGTIALRPQSQEFWRKLQELGYIESKNFIAEVREAHGDVDRLARRCNEGCGIFASRPSTLRPNRATT
jgi:putative ABC transport system substrate-binding protein